MINDLVDAVRQAMDSPWVYLALFLLALVDAFLPVVPSESLVITAGVFAAAGKPNLLLVIAVSALGAFAGDHVSYLIGRTAGTRLLDRFARRPKGRAAVNWANELLAERGGLILVIARYIPGVRTTATITMGAVEYPLRSFSPFDALAALSWAVYSALIGFLGGKAFEDSPLKGLLLGFGVVLSVTGLVELVRYLRKRRRSDQNRSLAAAHTAADATSRTPAPPRHR